MQNMLSRMQIEVPPLRECVCRRVDGQSEPAAEPSAEPAAVTAPPRRSVSTHPVALASQVVQLELGPPTN